LFKPRTGRWSATTTLAACGDLETIERSRDMSWYGDWKPYVPVAKRRQQAESYAKRVAKKEKRELSPVQVTARNVAKSFWGKAWCENLERYSDFENRLPRGRTYLRNGSVVDLQIERGHVKAIVGGSEIYEVSVRIKTLSILAWKKVKADCSQSIESLMDLMQGRFDEGIMRRLTHPQNGLFPKPKEITMSCTCPDWAVLCKHVAAVLYGVAARLDSTPELLFTLRDVDHLELVSQAVACDNLDRALGTRQANELAGTDLSELFGIEIDVADDRGKGQSSTKAASRKRATKRTPVNRENSNEVETSKKPARKASTKKAAGRKASATISTGKFAKKKARRSKRAATVASTGRE
jgi:uncharacterized Zn finger protein